MTLANQFDQLDVNAIRQFRTDGREEDIHLEFKTVNDPEMNRDDRKNLAKCISGFANSVILACRQRKRRRLQHGMRLTDILSSGIDVR